MTMDSGAASADKDIDGGGNAELAPKVVHQAGDGDPGRVSISFLMNSL